MPPASLSPIPAYVGDAKTTEGIKKPKGLKVTKTDQMADRQDG